MLTKKYEKISTRISTIGRSEQLYILPTQDGLRLLVLNLILLIVGLLYANNFVLLFNFIFFCLFIGSMFYTNFNLKGIELISAGLNPIYKNKSGHLNLMFKSNSTFGHNFLSIKFKNKILSLSENAPPFSFIKEQRYLNVSVPVIALARGVAKLNRICIQTYFPFHLFRCFIYFNIDVDVIIYPERLESSSHTSESRIEERNDDEGELTLKEFKEGDSLKQIHWKKFAQTNKKYSKSLVLPDSRAVMLTFSNENLNSADVEKELSSICFELNNLYTKNIKFGLNVGSNELHPDHSYAHLNRCLKMLAMYEI